MSFSFDLVKNFMEKECIKPIEINTENILWSDVEHIPVSFTPLTDLEMQAYEERKINSSPYYGRKVQPKKVYKKDVDWDIDVKNTSIGYFDKKGQFIKAHKEEEKEVMWIIRDEDKNIKGPYKTRELRDMEKEGSFKNMYLRRVTDRIFIPYEKLKEIENWYSIEAKLSQLFVEEKKKEKEIVPQCIDKNLKNCIKTEKLLKKLKINMSVEELHKKIDKKSRKDSSEILKKENKMIQQDVDDLLDVFLKEIKVKVCIDVDENGFLIVGKKGNKKK
ncbi:hypothetical protein SLOPH_1758 [Spraguea lophii 42_110]|uniref:Uncharacterized protein n=1 Tax=Spraguea lophii (strain 42_110) TaxID=1358809 RepID=S7W5Q7_SPRLO|nr:hypothetical protein SLOPH_1758 [Spraguea lophii 42_110]